MATLMQINERLREGKRDFEHLYRAIIANGSKIAAEYMEDGAIQYITYTEYGKRVRTCASHYPGSAGKGKAGLLCGPAMGYQSQLSHFGLGHSHGRL